MNYEWFFKLVLMGVAPAIALMLMWGAFKLIRKTRHHFKRKKEEVNHEV